MDGKGKEMVKHLVSLGVPGSEKLSDVDFGWIFSSEQHKPLASFLQWLLDNVFEDDLLTEEELEEYESLISRGEVLSGQQLEDMVGSLTSVPSLSPYTLADPVADAQLETLESRLQQLKNMSNNLGVYKIELQNEVHTINTRVQEGKAKLQHNQEQALEVCQQLSSAQGELAKKLDAVIKLFIEFSNEEEHYAHFLTQLDLKSWQEEEIKFTECLKEYITKQFDENMRELSGSEDTGEYQIVDLQQLDLHLVKGAGEAAYRHHVAELDRLSKLILITEKEKMEEEITVADRKTKIEELEKQMVLLQQGKFLASLPVIIQQIENINEEKDLVYKESLLQKQRLMTLLEEVAQLESTRTIAGNYQLKLHRQEYYKQKQQFVTDELLQQIARHDWVNIQLELENQRIKEILQILKECSSMIFEGHKNHQLCSGILKKRLEEAEQKRASGELPSTLETMYRIIQNQSENSSYEMLTTPEALSQKYQKLHKEQNTAREQLASTRKLQLSHLSVLNLNCTMVEVCLFGDSFITSLPRFWLNQKLMDRYIQLDEQMLELKQKLLNISKSYEEKKRVLKAAPGLKDK
ncbi:HAUS augmin-like complex subunit 3 [Oratosquilla oratoria]|uniref:HAUS augmin-like complex subunit 3 n=1 Tax=Oratosquilla oratoria TaxID=337810 RepID=UPI003F7581CE